MRRISPRIAAACGSALVCPEQAGLLWHRVGDRGWGSVTTMTKSQENSGGYSLKEMVKIAEKMGYGDDPFTKALRAGIEGKSPGGH